MSTEHRAGPSNTTLFLRLYGNLTLESEQGVRIRFYDVADEIEMTIVIDEATTITAIRNSWHLIAEWRQRLLAFQGRRYVDWYARGRSRQYMALQEQFQRGWSYQNLADWINEQVGRLLQAVHDREEDLYYPLDLALDWMRMMEMSRREGQQWIDLAMENLEQGEVPFPPGYPFDRDMVRERIRGWQRKGLAGWERSA